MVAVKSAASTALTLYGAVPRPDQGNKQGRAIRVTTNLFAAQLNAKLHDNVQQLAVDITPIEDPDAPRRPGGRGGDDKLPPRLLRDILPHGLRQAARDQTLGITDAFAESVCYDGKALAYSHIRAPADTLEWETVLPPKQDLPPIPGAPGAVATRGPPPPAGAGAGRGERRFKIKLTHARDIDFGLVLEACRGDRRAIMARAANPSEMIQDGIQALDIVLRNSLHGRYMSGTSQAAARKFFDPSKAIPISQGAEIIPGFFQSARPCAAGLVINLDPSFSPFVASGPLIEVVAKTFSSGGGGGGFGGDRGGRGGRGGFRGGRGGRGGYGGGGGPSGGPMSITVITQQDQRELRKRFKNIEIRVTHRATNKLESFQGFTPRSAAETEFTTKDGKTYTIVQYFLEKYNIRLRHPNLPCARIGSQKNAVPMEFCIVVPKGPIPATSLTSTQSADQIKQSAMRPDVRKRRVDEIRREVGYETDPMLRRWGITVSQQPLEAEARVIAPPEVSYAQGSQKPRVQFGSWNLVNTRFVKAGTPLLTWAVLDYTGAPLQAVQHFIGVQVEALRRLGIRVINEAPEILKCRPDPYNIRNDMTQVGKTAYAAAKRFNKAPPAPQLFMVMIEHQDQSFYNSVKKAAALDLTTPVATQCINIRKGFSDRGQPQYVANVSMKINVKLGGTNHVVSSERDLPRFGNQTMLIGADVTHPGPGSDRPSIAGSVATVDGGAKGYSFELRTQTNPRGGAAQEVMLHSKGMMLGHLRKWQSQNQDRLPDSIVFFRDGVSEGQYQSVLDHELAAIKQASREIRPDANIKVTFVVCGKGHHVRFFAQNQADNDRSGNLPAGTCVDNQIVSPFGFDFYLQSQAGLVGTARPCHYVVLRNEMEFSSENLIRCINSLCYTYCRATRSVSLVPPAYYADILCEKARAFVYGPDDDAETVTSSQSGERAIAEITEEESRRMMAHFIKNPAFTDCLWYM
ncbi:protein of unknown function DUF1785 [Kalmanozyma brasiliensis GHG001]|uniref:Uncharacterized protein n=1 Tax=Kalmanozyma brasiliensis (strain GHG001) TaxID=1365824 RepID=V5GT35_KALBG|nr:protein of unknown function DUF1785 [Kalmanozyma brasiliensis GHG001]EST09042.1 protein of unknown function DUF1785 [Kalmanozyma brasiliensis GHG001]